MVGLTLAGDVWLYRKGRPVAHIMLPRDAVFRSFRGVRSSQAMVLYRAGMSLFRVPQYPSTRQPHSSFQLHSTAAPARP